MSELETSKQRFLELYSAFEKNGARGGSRLQELRRKAIARFDEIGFPTRRQEEWRFTNVAPLAALEFKPAEDADSHFSAADVEQGSVAGFRGWTAVFVNGRFAPELSELSGLPHGVRVGSLADALESEDAAVASHLGSYANTAAHPFVALNTAFISDGAFAYVPKGTVISEPIQLLFLSGGSSQPVVLHPRNLIIAGENSQATIVESYFGAGEEPYFTNVVTEIISGENAVVDHYKLQREGAGAYHVASQHSVQARSSNFSTQSITLGGLFTRNDISMTLDGEGCEGTMNGLYMIAGQQFVDNHTQIDHAQPNCQSHEFYKGVLDGKSRGVFNGRIIVRQDAQKTNSKQTNQSLLLSNQALVNTNPQLEIFADDVKCTHGATVGQLEETPLFYLRTRGIAEREARSILTYAFANDIIRRIKLEPLRSQLEHVLLETQHVPVYSEV